MFRIEISCACIRTVRDVIETFSEVEEEDGTPLYQMYVEHQPKLNCTATVPGAYQNTWVVILTKHGVV